MKFIADLHLHSKYSRATSEKMTLEELDRWADDKGILVIATGDFTHPFWFKEIEKKLEPAEPGLFKLKKEFQLLTLKNKKAETRFFLSVEISSIYAKKGKMHRIHNLIFAPDLETVRKINNQLSLRGNLSSDGRPILGLDAEELAKIVLNINPEIAIVPAHIWTPWFSLFGSMSGFDSIEECFGNYRQYIFAGETGLSADPLMCWRLSQLDNLSLISNSDAHSLLHLGREANIFDTELSYQGIIKAIKSGSPNERKKQLNSFNLFLKTIEFYPEEGKYHYDGHRLCGVSFSPKETKKHKGICPVCGQKLTIGVLNRVDQLADREEGFRPFNAVPFLNLVPLDEIIAESLNLGKMTKSVKKEYENLIKEFGSEMKILLDIPVEEIALKNALVAEGIKRVREGKVFIKPGYDGVYGEIKIFEENERKNLTLQKSLF